MESLLMEESAMNLRRSSLALLTNSNHSNRNMYGGLGFNSPQYNYPPLYPCVSSITQLLLEANSTAGSFRGSLPPLYSSLPVVPVQRQPPLLPLPVKSATLPSTNKKVSATMITRSSSAAAAARWNNQKRKKNPQHQGKTSISPKKESAEMILKMEATPKPIENKPTAVKEEEEDTEEEFLMGSPLSLSSTSVYSLSPPPSSLPLPRLLLMRPRSGASKVGSCIAEAMGVGVDAGATDDLRRLLRL